MLSSALCFFFLYSTFFQLTANALRLPTTQRRRLAPRTTSAVHFNYVNTLAAGGTSVGLRNDKDLIYMANVSIGGTSFGVQLDTGSSDLWIQPGNVTIPGVTPTTLVQNITYGIGWASGSVATASVEFAGYTIPAQALLNVQLGDNPVLSYGASGILGLGFTSLSQIDGAVNRSVGLPNGNAWGRSFLWNCFAQNPSQPNYMTFALQRSTDPNASVKEGVFTIGEVDPAYSTVLNTNPIPTWPRSDPKRWTVLLAAYETGTSTPQTPHFPPPSVVFTAPTGTAVILLDSGTSYTYAPSSMVTDIYGNVPGAYYSPAQGEWIVPCDAQVYVSFWIGGEKFDFHPLDVVAPSMTQSGTCIGTFIPQNLAAGSSDFDIIAGDVFLRNVYSLFDFGDFQSSSSSIMGNPYVKLYSTTNLTAASIDFRAIRGGNAPLLESTNSSLALGSLNSTPSSSDIITMFERYSIYVPVVLAVLGLNTLVLIIMIIINIMNCRRRRARRRARAQQAAAAEVASVGVGSHIIHSDPEINRTYASSMDKEMSLRQVASISTAT
ncbi:hypothetical protein BOTBODRAFT_31717 [Botryobasidium botryosum FD-172 SS1]|uniref:Peptidase A1 domain-containing protein n=1 Tax=Botryobasidium botryosum (strain FD-172 SS1) TaxID=930990 RepID=A0A067ML13_BOTB1|nr:hypothetical protein BOTBODRAFT_31717 [Botryobasidium botryosum FD-172 SS1]